jgi:hypothetical protein
VRAQLFELRVAAGHEPLPGVVLVRELEEMTLIEEPELQPPALDQRPDALALERRDPGQEV